MILVFLTCLTLVIQQISAKGAPATTVPPCPPNEIFKPCGTACEQSCSVPKPKVCITLCIVNVCQCDKDHYRSLSGGCIPLDQCEQQVTCAQITCPCGRCIQGTGNPKPNPKCSDGSDITCKNIKCNKGYHCVQDTIFCLVAPCPQPFPFCAKNVCSDPNAEFLVCGKKCEPKCGEPVVHPCVDDGKCVPNVCQCKKGFIRNVLNNKCILPKDCPPVKG